MMGFLHETKPVRKLGDIIQQLQTAYCNKIGFEARVILFCASASAPAASCTVPCRQRHMPCHRTCTFIRAALPWCNVVCRA